MQKWIVISSLLLLWNTGILFAQPSATVVASQQEVVIGDHIQLQVSVNVPVGMRVSIPDVKEVLNGMSQNASLGASFLEFISQSDPSVKETAKYDVSSFEIVVAGFDEGDFTFPALGFGLLNEEDTIWSDPITIKIIYPELVSGDSTYLADIKNIIPEEANISDYYIYFYLIAGLFLITILIPIGIHLVRRMKQTEEIEDQKSPRQIALEKLKALEASDLLTKKEFKTWHTELSLIIKEYLNNVLAITALESTTAELLSLLKTNQISASLHRDLREVLETADLIKFAKASPLDEANLFAIKTAYQIIKSVGVMTEETVVLQESPEQNQ
ncbi:MAG: hypothetical protein MK212_08250 [Saprospiraceae bacterium]|nr:hypothetical protein [Saprospiraceae bacterium]